MVVESLAFGGDAVGHGEDGRVIFVPGGAPGDDVEVEIEAEHKAWLRTRLVRVVRPGPTRVVAPCPVFVAGCGGCQWQHVDVAAQRAAKDEIVTRALRNLPATVEPIASPGPAYGWRRRARLRFRRGTVGYARHRSHELLDATVCPQLEAPLEAALEVVRAALGPVVEATGELELLVDGAGAVQVALSGRGLEAVDAAALVGRAGIVSVIAGGRVHGAERLDLGDGPHPFWARADAFAQASAPGNAALRALVRGAAGDVRGRRALELFAGSGNFTRDLLAAGASVVAVEESAEALALARANLAPWAERTTFLARPAEPPLPDGTFDLVLVDPPRTGLGVELAGALAALACPTIYVSCDPQTLARDLAVLAAGRPMRAVPVDLMPQTFHIEIVVTIGAA